MSFLQAVPLIGDLLGIVSEAVTDKDKRNEINLKLAELQHNFNMQLVQSQTVPWVDATVKLIYALVALARPIGSFAVTAFGLYAHAKGIGIDTMTHTLIDSAFPAWMGARTLEKKSGVTVPRSGPPR
jgi:hypothetical protein